MSLTSSLTLIGFFTCFVSISALLLFGANSLHPETRWDDKEGEETEEWNEGGVMYLSCTLYLSVGQQAKSRCQIQTILLSRELWAQFTLCLKMNIRFLLLITQDLSNIYYLESGLDIWRILVVLKSCVPNRPILKKSVSGLTYLCLKVKH